MKSSKQFGIWYAREMRASFKAEGSTWDAAMRSKFVDLGIIEAATLGALFALLNDAGSRPNPLGSPESQAIIRANFVHTSMSVGDVAIDLEAREVWQCAPTGWVKLTGEVA